MCVCFGVVKFSRMSWRTEKCRKQKYHCSLLNKLHILVLLRILEWVRFGIFRLRIVCNSSQHLSLFIYHSVSSDFHYIAPPVEWKNVSNCIADFKGGPRGGRGGGGGRWGRSNWKNQRGGGGGGNWGRNRGGGNSKSGPAAIPEGVDPNNPMVAIFQEHARYTVQSYRAIGSCYVE